MPIFETRLLSSDTYRSDRPVTLTFELINTSAYDVYVLPWNTPLEGLWSDCLEVTRNSRRVRYDGPLVKRGNPEAQDYVLIKAGKTHRVRLPLHEAYPVARAGNYKVTVKATVEDFVVVTASDHSTNRLSSRRQAKQEQLPSAQTLFKVEEGSGKPRLTRGESARVDEVKRKQKAKTEARKHVTLGSAKEPKFTNGSENEKKQTKQAHVDAYNLCVNALSGLQDNESYKEWFGAHTVSLASLDEHIVLRFWITTFHKRAVVTDASAITSNFKTVAPQPL